MQLFPPVKSFIKTSGSRLCPDVLMIPKVDSYPDLINVTFYYSVVWVDTSPMMKLLMDSSLPSEAYRIIIDADMISVIYNDLKGLLHGLFTLEQLLIQCQTELPLCTIDDYPDLPIRGVLIDISRNKIPTLSTLQELVSILARMKINHLQLYVEGRSLEFPSQSAHYHEEPFSMQSYAELNTYCQLYGIDLVGNCNTFGHMSDWLSLPTYHNLAECPNGFKQWGVKWPASTLNPLDHRSLSLVTSLLDDFVPKTKSPFFNVNGDEPFELGRGKSKKRCEERSVESVYIEFMSSILEHVQSYGKTPMMWADVIIHHPELAQKLPIGTHVIDWGYDRMYDFSAHAKALRDLSIPFILAPGTSTWNSFTGRFEDMKQTTTHACNAAKQFGGKGIITTDWGDNGHLQYLPWSYLGFAYSAMLSWGDNHSMDALSWFLNRMVYHDDAELIAQAMMRLASYNDYEPTYTYNGTMLFQTFQYVDTLNRYPYWISKAYHRRFLRKNPLSVDSFETLQTMIQTFETALNNSAVDGVLKAELIQTIRWLNVSLMVRKWIQMPTTIHRDALLNLVDETIYHHERLWNERNLNSYLDESLKRIKTLRKFIQT